MKKEAQKPIKVLAVVCQMNRGGLESRLMDIIRANDYNRIVIDVFTYRMEKGIFDDEIVKCGGAVYYNPPLTVRTMFWYVSYFRRFLEEHPEYRIIHAHQDAWCSVFCKGAYLAGVEVRIAHSRTAAFTFSLKNLVKNVIKIPAGKYATHYFAVSKPAGVWLFGKAKTEAGKVRIWKNAINCMAFRYDPEKRREIRERMHIADKKVIIHVGNFTPPKNQAFLVDVLKKLVGNQEDYMLLFVGGETESGLQKKVIEKAEGSGLINHVLFLGKRSDVNDLLQAADVFCFPSVFEGLPGAVLEAQTAGLPCVISSAITEEVRVLTTTKMIPLRAGADVWSREIIKSMNEIRRDTYLDMVRAGFDIENLTNELMEFYETAGRDTDAIR